MIHPQMYILHHSPNLIQLIEWSYLFPDEFEPLLYCDTVYYMSHFGPYGTNDLPVANTN